MNLRKIYFHPNNFSKLTQNKLARNYINLNNRKHSCSNSAANPPHVISPVKNIQEKLIFICKGKLNLHNQ